METHKCRKDEKYIISTNSDCVVTDVETGIVLAVVLAKTQKVIVTISDSFTTSVECSVRPFVEATSDIDIIGGGEDYLPAGYKKLEYLESPSTPTANVAAYFALPISARNGVDSLRVVSEHFVPSGQNVLQMEGVGVNFGTFTTFAYSANSQKFFASFDGVIEEGNLGNGDINLYYESTQGEWVVYDSARTPEGISLRLNGELVVDYPVSSWYDYTNTVIGCFGRVSGDSNYVPYGLAGLKRSWKLYHNEVLLYDLIPALDDTGTPCMYDKVSHQSYYNSGSGDFIYPVDTYDTQTLDLDDVIYGKMTEYGVRRLYKVPAGETMTLTDYALANGYKEIVEPPMPTDGYWIHQWKETDTQLILEWVETEAPTEEL